MPNRAACPRTEQDAIVHRERGSTRELTSGAVCSCVSVVSEQRLGVRIEAQDEQAPRNSREPEMAFEQSMDSLQGELRKLRRQMMELAESISSAAARRTDGGREAVQQAGRQLVHAGERAGAVARRHPAATGLALLAVVGAVVCLAVIASQNSRGR
jgi:hypothetical protein